MLRALLADRFRMVARNTTAEMPIYALRQLPGELFSGVGRLAVGFTTSSLVYA